MTEKTESPAVRNFRRKTELALSRIQDIEAFREADTMVEYVFATGKKLFEIELDKHTTDSLLRTGGKLTGAYVYFGQKYAHARAIRDVYSQKASETEKELLLEKIQEGVKVTEARSEVASEVSEVMDLVNMADAAKNQWENITEATEKMVSFIQSAIKVKQAEHFQSSRLQDNAS